DRHFSPDKTDKKVHFKKSRRQSRFECRSNPLRIKILPKRERLRSHGSNLTNQTDSPSRRFIPRSDEAGAVPYRLPFGPLNDAADGRACACVPTIMMFVQSLHGISHNKMEETKEEHLELAEKAMQWIATR